MKFNVEHASDCTSFTRSTSSTPPPDLIPPPGLSIILRLARLSLRLTVPSLPASRPTVLWLTNTFIFALIRLRVAVAVTASNKSLLVGMILTVTAFLALLRVLLLRTMAVCS